MARPTHGSEPVVVSAVRKWTRRVLPAMIASRRAPAPPPDIDLQHDLELLFSELVSNAVRHGGGVTEVRLDAMPAHLRATVCDESADLPVVGTADNNGVEAENGRGMILVAALATRWGVHANNDGRGKEVWFELPIAA